jgi:hypothetical protein
VKYGYPFTNKTCVFENVPHPIENRYMQLYIISKYFRN